MYTKSGAVRRVSYAPVPPHPYGVEILRAHNLLGRVEASHFSGPQQIDFFLLLAVSAGELRHTIDFIPYRAVFGEWLFVKPGQVQRFDLSCHWDGFVIPIRSEFLEPVPSASASNEEISLLLELQKMPTLLRLPDLQAKLCISTAVQMEQDISLVGSFFLVESLLRQQLLSLVSRLVISHQKRIENDEKPAIAIMTFSRFRKAVDEHFRHRHHVHEYAALLGYSARTLSRACKIIADVSAKEIIDTRLILEAKRLLTHSLMPANRIALELGFEDASHFVKFFKRMLGCSPGEFRSLQNRALLASFE